MKGKRRRALLKALGADAELRAAVTKAVMETVAARAARRKQREAEVLRRAQDRLHGAQLVAGCEKGPEAGQGQAQPVQASGTIRGDQQCRLRRRAIGDRIREVSEERDHLSRIWRASEGSGRYGLGLQIDVLADELAALIELQAAVPNPDDPSWAPPGELAEMPAGLGRLCGEEAAAPGADHGQE